MIQNLNNLKDYFKKKCALKFKENKKMTRKATAKTSTKTSKHTKKQSKKNQCKNNYPKDRKKGDNAWLSFFSGKTPEGAKLRNRLISDHSKLCKNTGQEFNKFKFNGKLAKLMSIEYRKLNAK